MSTCCTVCPALCGHRMKFDKRCMVQEAYEEFKGVLLALMYDKDDSTSPVSEEVSLFPYFYIVYRRKTQVGHGAVSSYCDQDLNVEFVIMFLVCLFPAVCFFLFLSSYCGCILLVRFFLSVFPFYGVNCQPVSWWGLPIASGLATETEYAGLWLHWPIPTVGSR